MCKYTNNLIERVTINEKLLMTHKIIEKRPNGILYSIINKQFDLSNRFRNQTVLVDLTEQRLVFTKDNLQRLISSINFDTDKLSLYILKFTSLESSLELSKECDYYTEFSTHMNKYVSWLGGRRVKDNIYPTKTMVHALEHIHHPYVISPDMGAMERARHYAEMLGSKTGVFYKRRDLTQVIQGKNPILEHVYLGSSVKGKDVIVVDDMIASGTSMIEVAKELRNRGARKIVLCATFALFTEGTKAFEDAYHHHVFDQLYTTNLSYLPDCIKKQKWCQSVDFSGVIGEVIDTLSRHDSLQTLEVTK